MTQEESMSGSPPASNKIHFVRSNGMLVPNCRVDQQTAVVARRNKKYYVHQSIYPSTTVRRVCHFQPTRNLALLRGHSGLAIQGLWADNAHSFTTSNSFMSISGLLPDNLILFIYYILPFTIHIPTF